MVEGTERQRLCHSMGFMWNSLRRYKRCCGGNLEFPPLSTLRTPYSLLWESGECKNYNTTITHKLKRMTTLGFKWLAYCSLTRVTSESVTDHFTVILSTMTDKSKYDHYFETPVI